MLLNFMALASSPVSLSHIISILFYPFPIISVRFQKAIEINAHVNPLLSFSKKRTAVVVLFCFVNRFYNTFLK